MKLKLDEAFKKIREEDLDKQTLEHYHLALSGLLSDMKIEVATLKKEKALFMHDYTRPMTSNGKELRISVAQAKIEWESTKSGQRLIEMEGNVSATNTMVGSIKTRLYSIY